MIRRIFLALSLLASPAAAQTPHVITDIAPVQSLVAQVMADVGSPDLLLSQSEDPHHFQLRPSQASALERADLVVWIGPDLTPWLARALKGVESQGDSLPLLGVEGTHLRHFPADSNGVAALDPHAWLDPDNAKVWLKAIAARLSQIDPDHASLYRANADIAAARLDAAVVEIASELAPMKGKGIVVFHDAYNYFAEQFGLEVIGAVRDGDATAPGAAHLTALRKRLQVGDVVCAFGEPQRNVGQLETLVKGMGIRTGSLDPLGGALPRGPGQYEALLRAMADTIANCASGG